MHVHRHNVVLTKHYLQPPKKPQENVTDIILVIFFYIKRRYLQFIMAYLHRL